MNSLFLLASNSVAVLKSHSPTISSNAVGVIYDDINKHGFFCSLVVFALFKFLSICRRYMISM